MRGQPREKLVTAWSRLRPRGVQSSTILDGAGSQMERLVPVGWEGGPDAAKRR